MKKGTTNSSKCEKEFEAQLIEKSIFYIPNYVDIRYPSNCDFYIPDEDLFIELNIHWTHGGHWFDENNQADIDIVDKWNKKNNDFYKSAAINWTIRDVKKRKIAKENNLNYIVLWSKKDINLWFSLNCPVGKDWEKEYTWKDEEKAHDD